MHILTALFAALLFLTSGTADASEIEYLLQQARKGDVDAMHNVGVAYANGAAVARNYPEAMRWFEQAASLGQYNSMYSLAVMYRFGQGVGIDLARAYAWYALAAEHIPKDADEWFIPRAKIAMYERQPKEVAGQLSENELRRAEQIREEIRRRIHDATSFKPVR